MPLDPYVKRALDTQGTWKSPASTTTSHAILHHLDGLPMLEIEDWKIAFAGATDDQKRNLADAWVWNFAVRTIAGDYGYVGKEHAASVNHNSKWIQQIEPYVSFQQEGLDPPLEKCQSSLFARGSRQVNAILRPLWFGRADEKLSLLLELQNDTHALYQLTNDGLSASYGRIWEAALLPEATQQHKQAAAFISATIGHHRTQLRFHQCDIFTSWYEFGDICSRARPVGPEAISRLQNVESFIKEQDPTLALPVFVKLASHMVTEGYSLEQLSYPFAKNACYPLTGDPYAILRHWFPAYSEQWDLAESIGMDYVDAGLAAVTNMKSSTDISSADLPSDISPS